LRVLFPCADCLEFVGWFQSVNGFSVKWSTVQNYCPPCSFLRDRQSTSYIKWCIAGAEWVYFSASSIWISSWMIGLFYFFLHLVFRWISCTCRNMNYVLMWLLILYFPMDLFSWSFIIFVISQGIVNFSECYSVRISKVILPVVTTCTSRNLFLVLPVRKICFLFLPYTTRQIITIVLLGLDYTDASFYPMFF
jgi:hypothetical protein